MDGRAYTRENDTRSFTDTDFEAAYSMAMTDVASLLGARPAMGGAPVTPDECRSASLADLAFAIGHNQFSFFKSFWSFVRVGDYSRAAADLRGTQFYADNPVRGERNARAMESGILA